LYDTIIRRLDRAGVPYTIHAHPPTSTVADAEENLPFPKEQFLKTVVFKIKPAGWVLVALKGQEQVDYRKLAAALGVKRSDLVRAGPEEVETGLGMQIGGVCPIPPDGNTHAVFDAGALALGIVYCGLGRNDRTLEIRVRDLLAVAGGEVYPIARDNEPII
jgi:Cys-tRNA(Pro)/Cys-tRNA(Cys) deacylase